MHGTHPRSSSCSGRSSLGLLRSIRIRTLSPCPRIVLRFHPLQRRNSSDGYRFLRSSFVTDKTVRFAFLFQWFHFLSIFFSFGFEKANETTSLEERGGRGNDPIARSARSCRPRDTDHGACAARERTTWTETGGKGSEGRDGMGGEDNLTKTEPKTWREMGNFKGKIAGDKSEADEDQPSRTVAQNVI